MLVKGYVKDIHGQPIDVVSVQLASNLSIGKATNSNGYFEIDVPVGSVLKFHRLDYYDKEAIVQNNMNVVLESNTTAIEEVIVNIPTKEKTNWWLIGGISLLALVVIYKVSKKKSIQKKQGLKKPVQPRKVLL